MVGTADLLFLIASASKRCDLRGDERAMLAIASIIPRKVGRKLDHVPGAFGRVAGFTARWTGFCKHMPTYKY